MFIVFSKARKNLFDFRVDFINVLNSRVEAPTFLVLRLQ